MLIPVGLVERYFPEQVSPVYIGTGCQVGGHLQKGGKRGHFTRKGGQKEDIFSLKLIHRKQKSIKLVVEPAQEE